MQCASLEMLNESTRLPDDNLFSTHSAVLYALVRERAARVVSP